jgi:vitamin B12 transporter
VGPHAVQANLRRDDDSEFGARTTGSLAYGVGLAPGWRVVASVGSAFRVPTLFQRFSEYGVATLQPETSRNLEAGVQWQSGATRLGLVAYRNRIRDLIGFSSPGPCASPFGCYRNTARAQYQGITLSGSGQWGGAQVTASLDLQEPRDLDTGKRLARRAPRHASLAVDLPLGTWTVGGEAQLFARRFDDTANSRRLGGYGLLSLHAQTMLARDWALLARIDNVADKDYELARGYANAGRSVYLGVRWTPR